MTTPTTAFAWLEIPASQLTSAFSAGFTLSFQPNGYADNVTPPHPHNQTGTQQKGVSVTTVGGTWQVQSDNSISNLVAAGPYSEMTGNWAPSTSDKDSWSTDQDVIVFYVRYKPA
jgi:hypothetical protein